MVVKNVCSCYVFHLHKLLQAGPEPTVWPVRFWPDHFLLGARPLLVNAWDWALDKRGFGLLIIKCYLKQLYH